MDREPRGRRRDSGGGPPLGSPDAAAGRRSPYELVCPAAGGLWWWWGFSAAHPSTDDAYVGANVLTISPEVVGRVTEVAATENGRVAAGAHERQKRPSTSGKRHKRRQSPAPRGRGDGRGGGYRIWVQRSSMPSATSCAGAPVV